jgi:TonB-linked SusC/RagA family outer membrane protein
MMRRLLLRSYERCHASLYVLLLLGLWAQAATATIRPTLSKTISGIITNETGQPLDGVSIVEKGTSNGTTTNAEGHFSLVVAGAESLLEISYMGYKSQQVIAGDKQVLHITLLPAQRKEIDEVVVVGYGTKKKINLSGAVQSVSGEALASRSISNINSGLQGLIPNLNITPASGRPTDAPKFNIRGIASISGASSPLILIDNVPITAEELARFNPADVENVSVLKDAGAAAIYGARAAYGVVLITTKSAKSEKVQVTANFNYGIKRNTDFPDIITDPLTVMQYKHDAATPLYNLYPDAEQAYAKQLKENPSLPRAIVIPGANGTQAWSYYGETNWIDEIYRNSAPAYTADVSIAKRDDKLSYYLSAGYYRQEGSLKYGNDILNRYNFRGKAVYTVTPWLKIGNNTSFANRIYDSPTFLDGYLFWSANRIPSLSIPKNPDGTWTADGAATLGALQQGGRNKNEVNDFQTTFNTEVNLWKNYWTLKGDVTFRRSNETGSAFNLPVPYRRGPDQPLQLSTPAGPSSIATSTYASNSSGQMKLNVFNIYTDFHKTFAEKHYFLALAGFNQEYRYYRDFSSTRLGLITPGLPSPQLATGTIQPPSDVIADYALRGFFYRLNYIYDDKYIFEMNARSDGTSRFPENNRWGFFPSASVAWIVSKERFFKPVEDVAKLSLFKLRGSYGTLGNQVLNDNLKLNNYPYYALFPTGTASMILDGAKPAAVFMPPFVLQDQTWEKSTTLNLGSDMAFFDNKLEINYDWYKRATKGMIVKSKTLPGVFGTAEPTINAADLETKGWELSVTWKDQFKVGSSPLMVSARFSLSNSKTYITKYDNPSGLLSDYIAGQRTGTIWGLTTDGFFQNDAELAGLDQSAVGTGNQQYKFYVGDLKFKDLNGDKKINFGKNTLGDHGDLTPIGNTEAQFPYSLDLNSGWHGFDLRLFFQGVGKRDWYPTPSNIYYWGVYAQPWTNVLRNNLDHWTPENPNAYYPRVKAYIAEGKTELGYPQTKYLENAAYMRLKNITVGYTLPASLTNRWKIANLRVYLTGENIFTYKHLHSNMDPEAINQSSSTGSVVYPFQKTFAAGVNLNF